ncbi:MAG: lycopene cyclase domain-containing protein [Flavobacteriales bacterium]
MQQYYYLALDLLSLAFPLFASFDKRLDFRGKWPGLFAGIGVMALVFLVWDACFTAMGVWGFNPKYVVGVYIVGMPIEEWLFFLFIPYSCVFLYEVMRYFIRRDVMGRVAAPLGSVLCVVLAIVGVVALDRWYTAITFLGAAVYLAYHIHIVKSPWLGRFFVGYAISLIPFVLVNGILTGATLPEPIVWYNDAENLGIRIGTIPIEDSVYLLLLLLITVSFYERPLARQHGDLPPVAMS